MHKINFKQNIFFLITLTVIIFLLYGKSVFFSFTEHDDTLLISNNFEYISQITNIPKHFITSCYYNHDNIYYRPILSLSFAAESILFGLNTKIYHTTNIILFILALYTMFLVFIKLKFNINLLKFIFLILAVHPIFVSTVCWIPARNDTLLVIFLMLSLINLFNYIKTNSNKTLSLYFLCFTIALFTKETTLFFIPLYFSFIYYCDNKIRRKQSI